MTRTSATRFLCGLAIALVPSVAAVAAVPGVVSAPQQKVAGKPLADYPALWWQWAHRVSDGVRAYQDPTGSQCQLNQSGEVWFLAGTDGTADIFRRCTVPEGKFLFFPVINMIKHSTPGYPLACAEAQELAAANNDHLALAEVTLDGVRIPDIAHHRLRPTGCFDAFPNASYVKKPQSYFPAAVDGYWLMLRPLAVGVHHLSVKARYSNPGSDRGDLDEVFDYEIKIEDSLKGTPRKQIDGSGDIIVDAAIRKGEKVPENLSV